MQLTIVSKIMFGHRPKRFTIAQVLATLNFLNEEYLGGSEAEDQKNVSDWELTVSEEELSSEDDIENAPDLFATSDATAIPVTSNID